MTRADDLNAALAALTAAWNTPPTLPPRDTEERCTCGGDHCTCADGCGCAQCRDLAHRRHLVCSAKDCTLPSRFRVTAWYVSARSAYANDLDAALSEADADGNELVPFDERPSSVWGSTVCSYPHAMEVIAFNRSCRDQDGEGRLRFEVQPWQYRPSDADLPPVLADVRDLGHRLRLYTEHMAQVACPDSRATAFGQDPSLAEARRCVAALAELLAELDERTTPEREYRAGDPEPPADVQTVSGLVSRVPYIRKWPRALGVSRWKRDAPGEARSMSWDEVLADGPVVAAARRELVVPDPLLR